MAFFRLISTVGKILRQHHHRSYASSGTGTGKGIVRYKPIHRDLVEYSPAANFVHLMKQRILMAEDKKEMKIVRADDLHGSLVKHGIATDSAMCNLLRLYSSSGDIKQAERLFFDCYFSDNARLGVWNTYIVSLGLHGQGHAAIRAYDNMPEKLIKTPATYWNVLVACAHSGETEFAHYILGKFFKTFLKEPPVEHLGTYIDSLARKGLFKKAISEVCNMVYPPNREVITSILDRCLSYGDTVMAKEFVEELEKKGVKYSIQKSTYVNLAQAGIYCKSNVGIIRHRIKGHSSSIEE